MSPPPSPKPHTRPEEQRLHWLIWLAGGGGALVWLACLASAYYFAIDKDSAVYGLWLNLGSASLTIAVGGVIGGYVKRVFDRIEHAREDRQKLRAKTEALRAEDVAFFKNTLASFKQVYDIVEHVRLLLDAHKSAKTYGEMVRSLPDAIIILHNVKRALHHETGAPLPEIVEPIGNMIRFLKALTSEFQLNYLRISRLQSQDEANNRISREKAAATTRDLPDDLTAMAWDEIRKLSCIMVLRHDCPAIHEDLKGKELDALRAEAQAWPEREYAEHELKLSEAHRLLRRKYEVLFLDHIDEVSRILRERIDEKLRETADLPSGEVKD